MNRYLHGFLIILIGVSSVLIILNNLASADQESEPATSDEFDLPPEPTPPPRLHNEHLIPLAVYDMLLSPEQSSTPMPPPPPLIRTIMAFGDSITYGSETSSGGPRTAYPNYLNSYIGNQYNVINEGKGGETTSRGLHRFLVALDTDDPELVLLMEGLNDVWWAGYSYDVTELNLRVMVDNTLSRGMLIIIGTLNPCVDRTVNRSVIGFNPRIYSIAEDYNIPVADVFDYLSSTPNWQSLYDTEDGCHPNDHGEQIIATAFEVQVLKYLR